MTLRSVRLSWIVAVAAAVAVVALGASWLFGGDDAYAVDVAMPDAANLAGGGRVTIDGFDVGSIEGIEVRDGQALVRASVDDEHAPLPVGTTASIEYRALLGERVLVLHVPESAPPATIPDGGLITGAARVDLDQLLAALDEPTRAQISSLVPQSAALLDGREGDINASLVAAGPTVDALGEVLAAIGQDGPLLAQLLDDLQAIGATVTERRADVDATVGGLTDAIEAAANRRSELGTALEDLDDTAATATDVLERVPGTVDAVDPLLTELRPVVDQLPGVAADLRPLLADLRPAVGQLEPALANLGIVLEQAPALLDLSSSFLPTLAGGVDDLAPAVDFLRPYAPELVGWISNWGGAAAGYDANGHYLRINVKYGSTSAVIVPGELGPFLGDIPGLGADPYREPGTIVDEPWTDANGDPVR